MDMEGEGPTVADLQQDAAAKLRAYEHNAQRGVGGRAATQHGASYTCCTNCFDVS